MLANAHSVVSQFHTFDCDLHTCILVPCNTTDMSWFEWKELRFFKQDVLILIPNICKWSRLCRERFLWKRLTIPRGISLHYRVGYILVRTKKKKRWYITPVKNMIIKYTIIFCQFKIYFAQRQKGRMYLASFSW